MRLTAELINSSLSYINPLNERELDLRGHKIPAIENLGAAGDQDCIDFTDNDLSSLGNFPLSPRLRTLMCARNRIASIAPNLPETCPRLQSIVLAQNQIGDLPDLDPLASLPELLHLVLTDNPVAAKENYRSWVIWRCPTVRFLDFRRVKEVERERATGLFGSHDRPTELASKILATKPRHTFDAGSLGDANGAAAGARVIRGDHLNRVQLDLSERKRLEGKIRNATSLQEIARLERMLNEGRIPGGGEDGDAMEE